MKKILFLGMLSTLFMFSACEYDNYDAPDATLTGAIMYQNDTLFTKNSEVSLRLYEPGWPTSATTYLTIYVDQFGKYSASIFSGKTYKLIRNTGPWQAPTTSDTITFVASKKETQNIEVTPYFTIKNTTMQVSNNVITASFDIEQIDSSASIDNIQLCLFPNIILDSTNNSVSSSDSEGRLSGTSVVMGNNTMTKTITESDLLKYDFIYGRIGVKIRDVSPRIYSQPIKLYLN